MSKRFANGKPGAVLTWGLGIAALSGCPGPEEPSGPCAGGDDDPVLVLSNRGGGPQLADGIEVPVFPPPQGGVFTELDLTIDHLALEDLDHLRITIDATDTGEPLAYVRFVGDGIPLQCNDDDMLALEYAPIAFMDALRLEDIDGVSATVTGVLETTRGELATVHEVVLRSTDY